MSRASELTNYPPDRAPPLVPAMEADAVATIRLSTLLNIIQRNLWWIALLAFLATIGAALVVHLIPPRFQAEAVLQVAKPPPPALPTEHAEVKNSELDDLAVNSEIDAVLSVPVIDEVIDRLHLDRDPEFNRDLAADMPAYVWAPIATGWQLASEALAQLRSFLAPIAEPALKGDHRLVAQRLRQALEVSVKGKSRVIVVRAISLDPRKAANIANATADSFIKNRLEAKLAYTTQMTTWLHNRLTELRSRVSGSEAEVERLRAGIGQFEGQTATLLSEQLSQLTRQLIEVQADQSDAEAKYAQLLRLKETNSGTAAADAVLASPLIKSLREQESTLLVRRSEAQSQLRFRHPELIRLNAEVKRIQEKIASETEKIYTNITDRLNVLNSRVTALQKAKQDLERGIDTENGALVHLREVQREADTNRGTYEAFAIYYSKIAGLNEIEQSEAELLSQAVAPTTPTFPRGFLILALVASSTLVLGTMIALAREGLDQRFRSGQQVAGFLGLPTLALMPKVSRGWHPEDYVIAAPRSAPAEAIRYLYAELDRVGQGSPRPFKVLVSSTLPGEGKTSTSLMLAREAASNDRKTLLVNLDLRRTAPPRSFDVDLGDGWQAKGEGDRLFEPVVHVERSTGLGLLSFRTRIAEPFKLLYKPQLWQGLAEIASAYDLVVIDSPPILSVPDAKCIAAFVDTTLFLVKWGSTKRCTANEGLRHFRAVGAEIYGAVLTQVDVKKLARYDFGESGTYGGSHRRYYVET
jgi:polysaccharide biosynthesis transport protein